jgi:uncharacterized membrane protein
VDKTRLEAFSDGVFAIAITLLVLDLHVPEVGDGSLAHALWRQWPADVSYAVSFVTIGIIWVNHHNLIGNVARVTRTLLFLNLVLLLFVVALPFATATMAEYLTAGGADARVSMVLYAGVFLGMGLAFALLFEWTLNPERVHRPVPREMRRSARLRFSIGSVIYVVALGLAFLSPLAALILIGCTALYYVFEWSPAALRSPPDDVR